MRLFQTFIAVCLFLLTLTGCGGKKGNRQMSEYDKLKYEKTCKELKDIYAEAEEAATSGSASAIYTLRQKISNLNYSFDGSNMNDADRQKCQALADKIKSLKNNPDLAFQNIASNDGLSGTSIKREHVKVNGILRLPCSLNAGDNITLKATCTNTAKFTFYDISRRKAIKSWNNNIDEQLRILSKGIYMIEISSKNKNAKADVSLTFKGSDKTPRPKVREKLIDCSASDFLAVPADGLVTVNIFEEPKKIGLRGNLKSFFSGRSRALVAIPIPKRCDAVLYSLRISTNEKTVSSDGKFADHLTTSWKSISIMGVKVYERRNGSDMIERLLFNTRPPREEDAFCNMYVFTNRKEAKKFQDDKGTTGRYKYDVDQSQIGTQSCNGRLYPKGNTIVYMGFENERMRYDNYLWLEVAALTHTTKYVRPIYYIK